MNDLGLDGPIADASLEVQDTYQSQANQDHRLKDKQDAAQAASTQPEKPHYQPPAYSKSTSQAEDLDHELPTRWWYASTGFPLIAGTFGPMASAFSICALVEHWRVEVPPGGTEEHGIGIPDPKWLIAVNAASLACALIANLSLLLNMAKRVPFRWAQPVTIFGFWISSVLLIILVGIAAHDFHAPGVQTQALTQAYYYACWAAGLYQVISLMMCVTVYGALTGRYSSSFDLTTAQRTLMLQTIAFLVYLLIGALIFSHIEDWSYLNAVYWADFTLLTVGIGGDIVPTTHLARGLLFPFSIGGIVTLGLVVSSIRTMVLDRGKRKLHARMTEKMRRKVVKQVNAIYLENKAKSSRVAGLDGNLVRRLTLTPSEDPEDELDRRRAEFEAMRRVQELTSQRQKWMNLVVSTTSFAVLWFIGAYIFSITEGRNQGWTYFISLYFSWTSLLTIGYGDFIPLSNAGRSFFVFWSLLAVPSLTILISDMGDTVVKAVKDVTIWVGEVTILPSNQSSPSDRLRYGVLKSLGLQDSKSAKSPDNDEQSNDSDTRSTRSPFTFAGMVKLFKMPEKFPGDNGRAEKDTRMGADVENSKEQQADGKDQSSDHIAQDEHHYRHILISEIRKLYADTGLSVPKNYTYDEWAYYLKLLGEDESSSMFHRHAPTRTHTTGPRTNDTNGDDHARSVGKSQDASSPSDEISRWSWIGPRSPLMTKGDQSESEWLVARLFERLEESLRDLHKERLPTFDEKTNASSHMSNRTNNAARRRYPVGDATDDNNGVPEPS